MWHVKFKIVFKSLVMVESGFQQSETDMCLDCVGSVKFICC